MIKLINDDCFNAMKGIPDKSVDVSFTSPPYNRKRNDKYSNYNDTIENYYDFLLQGIELMRSKTKNMFL